MVTKEEAILYAQQYLSTQKFELPYDFASFVAAEDDPLNFDRDTWIIFFSQRPITGHAAVCIDAELGNVYKFFGI